MPNILIPSIKEAFSGKRKRWMLAWGILLGLSAPGYGLWLVAWIAMIPALHWVLQQKDQRPILHGGFIFGGAFQGTYLLWFWDLHPLTWFGFSEAGSWLVTALGWLLLVVEGGLLCGLLFLGFRWLARIHSVLAVLVFPLLWQFGFSLLSLSPLALPWGLIEYTQSPVFWMRSLATWIGSQGVGYLIVLHNTLWVFVLRHTRPSPRWVLPLLAPLLMLAGNLTEHSPTQAQLPVSVAALQGNVPIEIVRSPRKLTPSILHQAYRKPIRQADLPPGTLLVLPEEGALKGIIDEASPAGNPSFKELMDLAEQKRLMIAVGAITHQQGRFYNSIAFVLPESVRKKSARIHFYHKRHLVPFGEYTPLLPESWISEQLARWQIVYKNIFSAGEAQEPLEITAGSQPPLRLGSLICFELIERQFSSDYRHQGAHLLVNASNLGWFHGNLLLEKQFLAIAQMRAAETGIPLVIANNTGRSAILDGQGRLLRISQPENSHRQGFPKPNLIFYNRSR